MPNYQITCETPSAEIRYTIDGSEPNKNSTLYSGVFSSDNIPRAKAWANGYRESKEGGFEVGSTLTLDGVEVLVIYSQEDVNIAVDKNHDLSFYVKGSDYVNSKDYNQSPGTFGYEWGGVDITTGITNTTIGSGLSNTNFLIAMNLRPYYSGWYVVWDKVKEFRDDHSDKWFIPSKDELNLIYKNRANLSNITTSGGYTSYWSSSESEYSPRESWYQEFGSGVQNYYYKYHHYRRARLCIQF